ncbi:MAG: PD-(D/E)XK nuclease family protein, partial [Wenzhouxiangella sp.]|nr:PD-(D/E)XK nuclease family protein [Wenzhouxiangella sp.]
IQDAYVSGAISSILLSTLQARALWRSVINHQVFIGEPRVAEMAQASWRLIHEFELRSPSSWPDSGLSVDCEQFKLWSHAYLALCKRRGTSDEWQLASELPGLIRQGAIPLPGSIELSGFELALPPLQRSILQAAEDAGVAIERADTPASVPLLSELLSFAEIDDELRAAARWALERVERDPDARLAVVVPRLGDHLALAERTFRQVFDPAAAVLQAPALPAWHCSLGPGLNRWDLVADALACLQLDPQRMDQSQTEILWQSPFLKGAVEETLPRAAARNALWDRNPWFVDAGQLNKVASGAGARVLATHLRGWNTVRRAHRGPALPSQWIERFQTELKALGFGHGRTLDSREFQTLQRFHDLLEEFSSLDVVQDRPLPRAQTLKLLGDMAGDSRFRERNPGAAVEILGVEEALGSRFDGAWLVGLDDQTWPGVSRRDPFIPHFLQDPLPSANAQACLRRAGDELRALAWIAPERIGSYSRGSEDVARQPSRLLGSMNVAVQDDPETIAAAPMEWLDESCHGPGLAARDIDGGTRVLQDQSDCPFRAFARHRLKAWTPLPPSPGLDPRTRGTLVHKVLERFWTDLPDQAALIEMGPDRRSTRIKECIDASLEALLLRNPQLMTAAERALEADCLQRTVERWIAIELNRAPFQVEALEQPVDLQFAGLRLRGKIDRIDQVGDHGALILDYKTGKASSSAWFPEERLKEVQLPAYVSPRPVPPAGLAFARLTPDDLGFDGLAQADLGISGVKVIGADSRSRFKAYEDWETLRADWYRWLEQIADGFETGQARIEPRDRQACQRCDLEALCRIHEQDRNDE